ncbi:hypothetical protein BJ912DRAFT_940239 [Pholiota molesta]|nr:hypothetical protein BJ912DRAFT_940239 [Pholiota molesta]
MATTFAHSMPTPPFSPQNYKMPDGNIENPLNSTINLLDSLVAFYQQERMWVYRTQAVLNDAFSTPSTMESPIFSKAKNGLSYDRCNDPGGNPQDPLASRWARRKKGFKRNTALRRASSKETNSGDV